jgi:hypothetical protein
MSVDPSFPDQGNTISITFRLFAEPLTKGTPMFRRHGLQAFALALAFLFGMLLSHQPSIAVAQPVQGKGKCLGITVLPQTNGPSSPISFLRTFDDGTVEIATWHPGNPNTTDTIPWQKIGK